MSKVVQLSIILTAHHEGLLAHKTMLSVFNAIEVLKQHDISYEIIIHIDKGDPDTTNYFSRYKDEAGVRIVENNYGDAGLSRNFATNTADGEYITFLDADDLISSNWYYDAYCMLVDAAEDTIVHPEANLTFGDHVKNVLWLQSDSTTRDEDAVTLVAFNRWTSVSMGKKSIYQKHPFIESAKGYGHEDYYFNIATREDNIPHRVVPQTIQFYRRKAQSVFNMNEANKVTQPYSALFDPENAPTNLPTSFKDSTPRAQSGFSKFVSKSKAKLRQQYVRARDVRALNTIIEPFANIGKRVLKRQIIPKKQVPEYVISEWEKANQIECQLYPSKQAVRLMGTYISEEHSQICLTYWQLMKEARRADYVFIVPWIVTGGADKVLINYLRAFQEIHPSWHIEVITTVKSEITLRDLPDNTHVIDFGNHAKNIPEELRDAIFSRIIVELQTKNLHIINSEFGYRWAMAHKELIKHHYALNISLFSYVETPGKGLFSYADPYLLEIFPVVSKVFTDNAHIIDQAIKLNGFNREKFSVHYQPVDAVSESERRSYSENEPLRILWASRVDISKCPEVLCEIAKNLDPSQYQIDVYGRMDAHYNKSIFSGIPSLTYQGGYRGFNSIDTSPYHLFLYTSNGDGMPNILLEATAKGLPIISSDVGGIKEFIKNDKTGILIDDYSSAEQYIDAIAYARNHPDKLDQYVKNAQDLLDSQHSWSNFIKQVKKDMQ